MGTRPDIAVRIARRAQTEPTIKIIDYINTTHDALDVQDIYEFANKAMSSGGNLTYLYPWAGFDEGVALIYSGGPANMEVLQRAFEEQFNR